MLEGLTISLLGLLITFSALGLFILVMVLLKKLFPADVPAAPVESAAEEELVLVEDQANLNPEAEVAAAIVVAIAHFQSDQGTSLGTSLQQVRSPWWSASRVRTHRSPAMKR